MWVMPGSSSQLHAGAGMPPARALLLSPLPFLQVLDAGQLYPAACRGHAGAGLKMRGVGRVLQGGDRFRRPQGQQFERMTNLGRVAGSDRRQ
jgi:hypothetical protein